MENDSSPANCVEDDELFSTQKGALARVKKKSEFLANLLTNLDTLIYVELCIVYYMDCSLFRLLFRLMNQMIFLTPKAAFIHPATPPRPYLGAIFIPGLSCMLLHALTARSEAGEAARGYLHGGIIIDLIGQRGPTSKVHLLGLDLLLLVLQCFMLTVSAERERLRTILTALASPRDDADADTDTGTPQSAAAASESQDRDSEERGVIRNQTAEIDLRTVPEDSSELQQGMSSAAGEENVEDEHEHENTDRDEDGEQEGLLARPCPRAEENEDEALELFWSGMAIVADFHILQNLRKQWRDYGTATGLALQTVGYSAELGAITANRRLNVATTRLQQGLQAPRNT